MNKRTDLYLRWGLPIKYRLRELAVRAVHAFGRRMDWWLDQALIKLDLDSRASEADGPWTFIIITDTDNNGTNEGYN